MRIEGGAVASETGLVLGDFPPLWTSRLFLEPVSAEVAHAIARGDVADLGVARGWPQAGTMNGVAMAIERGHPAGWLVRWAGRVIGDCGIHAQVDGAGCVEIGYGLAEAYQQRGYGTELVAAISDWLCAQPSVLVVRARTLPSNAPSRRVLEKAGFGIVEATESEIVYERRA